MFNAIALAQGTTVVVREVWHATTGGGIQADRKAEVLESGKTGYKVRYFQPTNPHLFLSAAEEWVSFERIVG